MSTPSVPPAGTGASSAQAAQSLSIPLIRVASDEPEDRGRVALGGLVRRRVSVTNISGETVELRVGRVLCGCVDTILEPRSLSPSASAALTMGTPAVEAAQEQFHHVEVVATTRDSLGLARAQQSVLVQFSYTPDVEVVMEPTQVMLRGRVGTPGSFDVFVRRVDGKPVTIDRVDLPGPWVRVRGVIASTDQPELAIVRLESATDAIGTYSGAAKIHVAGVIEPRNGLDVTLRVDPALRANPPGLVLRQQKGRWPSQLVTTVSFSPLGGWSLGAGSRLEARLGEDDQAISIGQPVLDDAHPGNWILKVTFHANNLAESTRMHGRSSIEIRDVAGLCLCRLPIVWLADAALTPHAADRDGPAPAEGDGPRSPAGAP